LYVYNFFPSDEGDSSLDLTNNSKTKITVFIELLGIDTHTLTSDEDVGGRGLFDTKSMVGDDVEMESELKFLRIIQGVKQSDATLFARIKKLPPKCNTIREYNATGLLSYFRQGMVMKTILTYANQDSIELSFFDTANALECTATELRLAKNLDDIYFSLFEQNRAYYKTITTISRQDSKKDNKSPRAKLLAILRAIIRDTNNLSNDDREYWAKLRVKLERGDIPKNTAKNTLDKIDEFIKSRNMQIEARQLIELCRDSIALELLDDHLQSGSNFRTAKTDIILAEYFTTK